MKRALQVDRMKYWDEVYSSRPSTELGWYQQIPEVSLEMIHSLDLESDQGIIDIGGGDSLLPEFLLDLGFTDLNLLDISENAIQRSRLRMGTLAEKVNWINSDVVDFKPGRGYDLWHDRACFHFLTCESEVLSYAELATEAIRPGGYLILGAFAQDGPEKCSGLAVQRYGREELEQVFIGFELQEHRYLVHQTPSGFDQHYIFCLFKRKQ